MKFIGKCKDSKGNVMDLYELDGKYYRENPATEVKENPKSSSNTAYCVKCKKKVHIQSPKEKKNKKGMKMLTGHCPKCNTKVFRILGK